MIARRKTVREYTEQELAAHAQFLKDRETEEKKRHEANNAVYLELQAKARKEGRL